jgi:hypothetical protein
VNTTATTDTHPTEDQALAEFMAAHPDDYPVWNLMRTAPEITTDVAEQAFALAGAR